MTSPATQVEYGNLVCPSHSFLYSLQYRQSVFFAGQLTVLRNIEYFRRFFAAKYQPKGSKAAKHLEYPAATWYDGFRFTAPLSSVRL
jgi:hypothetical protein